MARGELLSFIRAAEHNLALRRELRKCSNNHDIQILASKYGFSITAKDIEQDEEATKIEEWFKSSRIAPIGKN